ncbi:MAG: hypothetical protein UV49_C0019G0012 [candidate division WWE3 bacterium GW2011_GWA2_42_9]|nr:MAG: hypothetical protein UV49_C0019G0012 [candidate division WWE3 bacterium GW2011_GWA2_42_9]
MSPSYADLKEKIEQVKLKLKTCAGKLEEIEPAAKGKYPNPQLRLWPEDVKDLIEFATGLEEWLSHPLVAEAKRQNKECILCGELAADVAYTKKLIGLGLENFSVSSVKIPQNPRREEKPQKLSA